MHIGQLAQRVGLSPDTIRFYEKQGLLDASLYRRHSNNYRVYQEAAVEQLLLIKQAKRYGYTLSQLRQLNSQWQANTISAADKQALLRQKLGEIDQQLCELQKLRQYVTAKLARLETEDPLCQEC